MFLVYLIKVGEENGFFFLIDNKSGCFGVYSDYSGKSIMLFFLFLFLDYFKIEFYFVII